MAAIEPLERLVPLTMEIFEASDSVAPLESIASAVSSIFRFRRVTIALAEDENADAEALQPEFGVLPGCFYRPHVRTVAEGESQTGWHPRDLLTIVLSNVDGKPIAYLKADHAEDGKVPSIAKIAQMRAFADLIGLAMENARILREQRDRIAGQSVPLETSQSLPRETKHAPTDPLTGLVDRKAFDEAMAHEWHRSERNGAPLAMIFIDVDGFKAFEQEYGKVVGDRCLGNIVQCIAARLKRPDDFFARYGDEQFAILLPTTDEDGALAIADELCINVFDLSIVNEHSEHGVVSISAGVASLVPKFEEAFRASLGKAADSALRRAKDAGGNCVVASSALRTTQWAERPPSGAQYAEY
jgi:diguanylate cyclase (GGDEF)-like protein